MMLGVPIAFSLGFTALVVGLFAFGPSVLPKMGNIPYYFLFGLAWIPLPLFVLLGSLIAETRIGEDLFYAARKWLSRIPGGLIVSAIMGEAVMAATLGTSAACIILVGKVAVPEFERHGYNRSLGLGALLAGGVLGPLIPPSATMIIYSVLTNVSLGKLFIAGIIPGIILALTLSLPAFLICWFRPQYGPVAGGFSWRERFGSLTRVWPVVIVILAILGSIYLGVATPTESAGIGVVAVLIIGIAVYKLRWNGLRRAASEAALINSLMLFAFIGALLFSFVMGSANMSKYISEVIESSAISPWVVVVAINVILLVLGCIIDPITITFLSIPIFVPLITSLGFDPLWFGVVFVVNTQIGLITPPMGIDLFAIKTVFDIPTGDILRGVAPFLFFLIIFLAIITAFPTLSLWLPGMMIGG
jgi:C4-dicarboxylate transporter DctM subunit